MLETQLQAIEAYEKVMGPAAAVASKRRKRAASLTPRRRRRDSNRTATIREAIQNAPDGIDRKGIIEALGCKGDKAAEQAVSNTLARLKKTGDVAHEGRTYRWSGTDRADGRDSTKP